MQGFGRYKIVRPIGTGGMAEVLEGLALGEGGFQRRVAIKRMHAHVSQDPVLAKLFVHEAKIASHLHHPNIAAVLDFGVVDGQFFQVLEFVDGVDARTLFRAGAEQNKPMPEAVALTLVREVAVALAHAHTATDEDGAPLRLVHRDVTPGNILVGWNGAVKLTDFGIALSRERQAERTQTGLVRGTPPYMAPEQSLGGEVDGRTDVFALGCVLHFLIVGASPLSNEENLIELARGGALRLDARLPTDVRSLVAKATSFARSQRFPTAEAFGLAIDSALRERLSRDPMSLFREWLSELRPGKKPSDVPRAGRFDALLCPEIRLTAPHGEVRRFETQAEAPAPRTSTSPISRELGSGSNRRLVEHDSDTSLETPAVKRGRRAIPRGWVFGGVALGVASLGFVVASAIFSRTGAVAGARASAPSPDAHPPAVDPPLVLAEDGGAMIVIEAKPPTGLSSSRSPSAHHEKEHPLSGSLSKPAARLPVTPVSPRTPPNQPLSMGDPDTVPSATAVLVVAGEGATRRLIRVDGRSIGYAPREVELPVGSHTVELVGSDGQVRSRTVALSTSHTVRTPYRWLVEE